MTRALVDPDGVWDDAQHFTGFWRGEPWAHFVPPASLVQFLTAGAPPVIVTMGSMLMFDAARFVDVVSQALRESGQRGVIVGGWPGLSLGAPSASIYHATEIPYDWLLPRASCVVHHGGCGTIGSVLRAGTPSILLPQIKAQELFAEMLIREGLATGTFDIRTLDASALAAAIRSAVFDERVLATARRWQTIVSGEGGVASAADLIESHANTLAARRTPA